MNIILLGAAGFIGTNLALELFKNEGDIITLVDKKKEYFIEAFNDKKERIKIVESDLDERTDYNSLLKEQDIVYHLVSTVIPSTSNQKVAMELSSNITMTTMMLEASVRANVKKVMFISSGGTVYGKEGGCPLKEETPTNPITSYGIQKLSIEKILYLYNYMYGLDYRVVRLANPYGPYQRPNGMLGAVTTFIYKALKGETISVYGDGSVIRDFIYIDDAVKAIIKIANGVSSYKVFNVGSGLGVSINEVLKEIEKSLGIYLHVEYKEGRAVDVPVNFLDISRYEKCYGQLNPVPLCEGIKRTAEFMQTIYEI